MAAAIRLEPCSERHLADVDALVADPAVLRITRLPEPPPPEFARTWLAAYREGRRDGSREAFAIVDAGGAFLGIAVAPRIERAARTAELGYVVAPAARGPASRAQRFGCSRSGRSRSSTRCASSS
jgi:RimJ/RimL family protein N-acetyltransferase